MLNGRGRKGDLMRRRRCSTAKEVERRGGRGTLGFELTLKLLLTLLLLLELMMVVLRSGGHAEQRWARE